MICCVRRGCPALRPRPSASAPGWQKGITPAPASLKTSTMWCGEVGREGEGGGGRLDSSKATSEIGGGGGNSIKVHGSASSLIPRNGRAGPVPLCLPENADSSLYDSVPLLVSPPGPIRRVPRLWRDPQGHDRPAAPSARLRGQRLRGRRRECRHQGTGKSNSVRFCFFFFSANCQQLSVGLIGSDSNVQDCYLPEASFIRGSLASTGQHRVVGCRRGRSDWGWTLR
jgi:hypothetical protein